MDKEPGDIKTFSAEDIQRYYAGEMSSTERHALEKAALEDPFLSEAIEGYANTTTASEDVKELKKRLFEKETKQKIIPILVARKSIHPALKVAAIVLIIASAGWLINQRSLNNYSNLSSKSGSRSTIQSAPQTFAIDSLRDLAEIAMKEDKAVSSDIKKFQKKGIENESFKTSVTKKDTAADNIAAAVPMQKSFKSSAAQQDTEANHITADVAMQEASKRFAPKKDTETNQIIVDVAVQDAEKAPPKIESRTPGVTLSTLKKETNPNYYTGRIVDEIGYPIPFASIKPNERKGFTTDAMGNFSIPAADSNLLATINATGYQSTEINLNNYRESYSVIMRHSDQQLQEVVATAMGQDRDKDEPQEKSKKVLNAPDNYNAYLANNTKQIRDNENNIIKGKVVLSFEVNINGEPINIRVEKSLYPACDEEAKRLLMEGPKWKQKRNRVGELVVSF